MSRPVPDGLASQPTLSRLVRRLSSDANRRVLRGALLEGEVGETHPMAVPRGCQRLPWVRGHALHAWVRFVNDRTDSSSGRRPLVLCQQLRYPSTYQPLEAAVAMQTVAR